jgi:hypothetical protein
MMHRRPLSAASCAKRSSGELYVGHKQYKFVSYEGGRPYRMRRPTKRGRRTNGLPAFEVGSGSSLACEPLAKEGSRCGR